MKPLSLLSILFFSIFLISCDKINKNECCTCDITIETEFLSETQTVNQYDVTGEDSDNCLTTKDEVKKILDDEQIILQDSSIAQGSAYSYTIDCTYD
ncbi:MAG: hypothetical protein HRT72_12305 [Flavobacteriales bacterium]|nr:hypothetical protein [Flavobacteriales bacterium]